MALAVAAPALGQTTAPPITLPQRDDLFGGASNSDGTIGAGVTVDGQHGDRVSTGTSTAGGSGETDGSDAPGTSTPSPDVLPIIWRPAPSPSAVGDCTTGAAGTSVICYYDPATAIVGCLDRGVPGGCPVAPGTTQTAREIASSVSTRAVPFPGVKTSPPTGADQLVNLPTWLWVDSWDPVSTTASEGGLTVTVTASPVSVTWNMGIGTPVVCEAGTPWNPSLREEQQSSPCTFTYTRSSFDQPDLKYFASATMTWDVIWTASNGESGSLGQSNRTTSFRMRVAEGQAVITSSGV